MAIGGRIKKLAKVNDFNFKDYVDRLSKHHFISFTDISGNRAEFSLREYEPDSIPILEERFLSEQAKCDADGYIQMKKNGEWIDIEYSLWVSNRHFKKKNRAFVISVIVMLFSAFIILLMFPIDIFYVTFIMPGFIIFSIYGIYYKSKHYSDGVPIEEAGLKNHIDNLEYHLEEKDRGWLE